MPAKMFADVVKYPPFAGTVAKVPLAVVMIAVLVPIIIPFPNLVWLKKFFAQLADLLMRLIFWLT